MSTRAYDFALATASGVLLTLSFPKFGHPAFAWIALAPLLVALASPEAFFTARGAPLFFRRRGPTPGAPGSRLPLARARAFALARVAGAIPNPDPLSLMRGFALGLTTGIVYFTGTLYWITRVMVVYGGLQGWVAVLVNAALIAYLALFPAIFAIVMRRLVFSLGTPALMIAPLVWVTTELGRTHLFTGFPWVLLGYSQVTMLPIAQLASVFGVYGVSALVASVSAAAALVVSAGGPREAPGSPTRQPRWGGPPEGGAAKLRRRARASDSLEPGAPGVGPRRREKDGAPPVLNSAHWTAVASVATMVLLVAVWGGWRAARAEWTRAGEPIQVGLVQGNVDQAEKWNAERAAAIFQEYLNMTRQAIGKGAEFVLWPE